MSVAEILDDLARRLRERRQELKLSQLEAALSMGVSPRTYEYWEKGRSFPQPRHRRAIDEFLGEVL